MLENWAEEEGGTEKSNSSLQGYNKKFQVTYAEIIGIRRTIAHGTHEVLMVPTSC